MFSVHNVKRVFPRDYDDESGRKIMITGTENLASKIRGLLRDFVLFLLFVQNQNYCCFFLY